MQFILIQFSIKNDFLTYQPFGIVNQSQRMNLIVHLQHQISANNYANATILLFY